MQLEWPIAIEPPTQPTLAGKSLFGTLRIEGQPQVGNQVRRHPVTGQDVILTDDTGQSDIAYVTLHGNSACPFNDQVAVGKHIDDCHTEPIADGALTSKFRVTGKAALICIVGSKICATAAAANVAAQSIVKPLRRR